jgi:hypothetical protein
MHAFCPDAFFIENKKEFKKVITCKTKKSLNTKSYPKTEKQIPYFI